MTEPIDEYIEQWRPVRDFEGLYEVSDHGRVRSNHGSGRIMRHGVKPGGYEFIGLYKRGERVYKMVHRIVALEFIQNESGKPEVNHIDGDKRNNRLENLEWTTRSENAQHGHDTGLMAQAERHHSTKLTASQVVEIFKLNGRYEDIGMLYGVCKQTVCKIKNKNIHKRRLEDAGL